MNVAPRNSRPLTQGLSVRQTLLAMLGLCCVVMMVAIDQTVVGTALPTVVAELNGFELYAWVGTSYLLASVIMVPVFGRLGDYYGRKPFVIAAIAVFSIASVLCGMAGSMLQLVLARGLQGVGGGMLVGTAFACIPDLFPDPRVRLRWQVMFSSAYGLANAVGPTLGGVLTHHLGWRSVFYVNVPISLLGLWLIAVYLPRIRHQQGSAIRLDWPAALLIAACMTSLQLFVQFLPNRGLDATVAACGAAVVLTGVALYFRERHCSHPLLPLELFHNRSMATLFGLSALLGVAMFGMLFYVPLLLQGGFALSPQVAGFVITPLVVCITVASICNSRILMRLPNPTVMLYVGFALLVVATAGLLVVGRSTSLWLMAGFLVLGGLGMGFLLPNLMVFSQEIAGRAHLGIATAVLQSTRMIGGMIGMATVGSLVNYHYVNQIRRAAADQGLPSPASRLEDPQLLVNAHQQADFVSGMHSLGIDGAALIELARSAMVSAVHWGLVLVVLAMVAGFFWVRCVGKVVLVRDAGSAGN